MDEEKKESLTCRSTGQGLLSKSGLYEMSFTALRPPARVDNALFDVLKIVIQVIQSKLSIHFILSQLFSLTLRTNHTTNTLMPTDTPKTAPVQGRVAYDIYLWLDEKAKAEERSIGYYVAKAVEAYYQAEKDKPA